MIQLNPDADVHYTLLLPQFARDETDNAVSYVNGLKHALNILNKVPRVADENPVHLDHIQHLFPQLDQLSVKQPAVKYGAKIVYIPDGVPLETSPLTLVSDSR